MLCRLLIVERSMAQAAESCRGLPLQLNAFWLALPWVERGAAISHAAPRSP